MLSGQSARPRPEGPAHGAFAFHTGVGMLDLDRVVMILPQVHLRNGEMTAELIVDLHTRSTRRGGRVRGALQSRISAGPSSHSALLSQGPD